MAKTIEISNFGGRLTRVLNGEMNSGLAKFLPSWGYDPFTKPGNLMWLEKPTDIGTGSVFGCVLDAKPRSTGATTLIYAVACTPNTGKLYAITPNSRSNPNLNQTSLLGAIAANSPSFDYGASMDFYGVVEKIYIGSNNQINSINFDGSSDTVVGSAANYFGNTYRPLKQFVGKLCFGNGNTIGAVSQTGTVTSSVIGTGNGNLYSEFNPPLPVESRVHDLDNSIDGNYLLTTASYVPNENILTVLADGIGASASEGALYKWNGSDQTTTAFTSIPSYALTSLQTYLSNNMFFANDSFGAALNDGTNKLLTLTNNKPPLPNATTSNANFLTWMAPEASNDRSSLFGSLYYYGRLDEENPVGLYRMLRYTSILPNGFVYQIPMNRMVNNRYFTLNNSISSVVALGYGRHYFSTFETSATTSSFYGLYSYNVTPTGTGTPNLGVYETQTQLFAQRVAAKQVRVYTEPTATGNGFQLDLIGSDGLVINNSSFTYTYSAGTDLTLLQGSLERINFNPAMPDVYAIGVRITNTGTTNMTIKKIELDVEPSGK